MGERRARAKPTSASTARLACLAVGTIVILAAIFAFRQPGSRLLYWHTAERLLIGDLATLLLAIGLAGLLPPLSGWRVLRTIAQPQIALPLWIVNYLVWMLPGPYDAAMRHSWLRVIDDVLLIGLSLNMWLALLDFAARARSTRSLLAFAMIGRLVGAAVACVAIWSPDVYYPFFLHGESLTSTSPQADQGIAGAIMLAEMALTAALSLLWLRVQLARVAVPVHATPEAAPAHAGASSGALAAADVQI